MNEKNYLIEVEVKQKVNLYINGEDDDQVFENITAVQTYETKAKSIKEAMGIFLTGELEIVMPEQYPDLEEETGDTGEEVDVRDVLGEDEPHSISVFENEEDTYPIY